MKKTTSLKIDADLLHYYKELRIKGVVPSMGEIVEEYLNQLKSDKKETSNENN